MHSKIVQFPYIPHSLSFANWNTCLLKHFYVVNCRLSMIGRHFYCCLFFFLSLDHISVSFFVSIIREDFFLVSSIPLIRTSSNLLTVFLFVSRQIQLHAIPFNFLASKNGHRSRKKVVCWKWQNMYDSVGTVVIRTMPKMKRKQLRNTHTYTYRKHKRTLLNRQTMQGDD